MMRAFSLSELSQPLGAKRLGDDVTITAVTTDSRQAKGGDLFVALVGEHFDGHDFVDTARERGASAAVVERSSANDFPQLQVNNSLTALGALGAANRQEFAGSVVAVTGSVGKTTVKNLLASIFAQVAPTFATEGNFNNEIGVPLTLLQLAASYRFAVVEMGAAKAGDIAYLCSMAKPSVAMLLNAMPAHLSGFGSVDGVAAAKGEIVEGLGEDGCAVINADSPYAKQWQARAGAARVVRFSMSDAAEVYASDIVERGLDGMTFTLRTPEGDQAVQCPLQGRHNVMNAVAAAAGAYACGVELADIVAGLESAQPQAGRLVPVSTTSGADVIDDSYNANPGSVRAAIDVLAALAGKRYLLLGAMAELGSSSDAMHADVGKYAAQAGIDEFWVVGEAAFPAADAFGGNARCFPDMDELIAALATHALGAGDTVLVKGSRSAGMERAVAALTGEGGQ